MAGQTTMTVDSDRSSSRDSKSKSTRKAVARLLARPAFDIAMGIVIVANSATIGLEMSFRLEKWDTAAIDVFEHVFLGIYTVELVLRFYAHRLECLESAWTRFDLLLVVMGIVTNLFLFPLVGDDQSLAPLMVIRTARLLRLARTVRLLIKFRELWMLVRGLLNSGSTMFHTLLLCLIILYIFGCVSVEMITLAWQGKEEELSDEFHDIVQTYFRSLPTAMLTLVQFISFDNIVYIYKPMIEADAKLAIFFALAILVVGVVLMNLVTAVIVNSALEQAMQDKDLMRSIEEQKKKKMMKQLKRIFMRLDVDRSGKISRDELINISKEDHLLLTDLITTSSPVEMFDSLDIDGSGDIDIGEFCRGIEQVAFSNTPIELKRMERQIESMHKQLMASFHVQDALRYAVAQLLEELHASPQPKMGRLSTTPPWAAELSHDLRRDVRRMVNDALSQVSEPRYSDTTERPPMRTSWVPKRLSQNSGRPSQRHYSSNDFPDSPSRARGSIWAERARRASTYVP